MKLKTLKPLYLGGKTLVEGTSFETGEQHGRELLQKGYAAVDEGKDAVVVDLTETESDSKPLTTTGAPAATKTAPKEKAADKKKAD
ncbi:DUF7210 family protein [Pseudomonas sp. 1 R 17]|uniref:DUF7210 family protein n=1 Tax=Pseudomonas sp. 1 R 17 TaxID=1844091 RepID=UPI0008121C38|nr:hypothetical protein [Pseudomonas sp. 1 R 17]SAM35769.1 hypothetical protein BN1864_LIB5394:05816 [Pseudomonas sp. 1 R 17]